METRRLLPSCGVRFSTTGAKASLISTVSIRSIDIPVRLRPCWIAGIGAVSIITGSAPRTDMSWVRARGVRLVDRVLRCDQQRRGAVGNLTGHRRRQDAAVDQREQIRHLLQGRVVWFLNTLGSFRSPPTARC